MKKKKSQLNKKLQKTLKAINRFIQQTIKNYKTMTTKIGKIWLILAFLLCSCGSTKVSVEKPAAGTQTTITVTTNNPITTTTDVNPKVDLNMKGKQQ